MACVCITLAPGATGTITRQIQIPNNPLATDVLVRIIDSSNVTVEYDRKLLQGAITPGPGIPSAQLISVTLA
jgi:hypothetical protein